MLHVRGRFVVVSTKQRMKSAKAANDQKDELVYDFLYFDTERIASFLAQLNDLGQLQSISNNENKKENKSSTTAGEGKVGAGFFNAGLEVNQTKSSEENKTLNTVYDARWLNALNFLNIAEQKKLINNDIKTSAIGQLVLFSGNVFIYDSSIASGIMTNEKIKRQVLRDSLVSNQREKRKNNAIEAMGSDNMSGLEFGIEVSNAIPTSIQFCMRNGDILTWSSLDEKNMTIRPLDLILKHGLAISGNWSVIGILDAVPTLSDKDEPTIFAENKGDHQLPIFPFGQHCEFLGRQVYSLVRKFFGKPNSFYGVTPLLIFRSVIKGS